MQPDINWNDILLTITAFLRSNAVGIVLSLFVIILFERLVVFIANRYVHEDETRHAIRKWARYIAMIFAFLWILLLYTSYAKKDTPFFLFLIGLFLAGVAISLRDVFSNIVGWMVIMSSKGFRTGDRIVIGADVRGDVIDIGVVRTVIAEIGGWVEADQSSGRLVTIPNSMVLSHPVWNYTEGYDFIWNEIKILVTFESNWQKAEQIMVEIASRDFEQKKTQIQDRLKGVRKHYLLRYNYISPKVYVFIDGSGVRLTLRYMVRARRRRTLEDLVSREILQRFNEEPDVDLAYPTIRYFSRGEEKS